MELGRNSPCPCGSGKKYKHCCLSHSQTSEQAEINMLFIRGQQAHSTGRFSEAEGVYSAILRRRPDHPEALHFQGLLYHQSGRHQIASSHIERSLSLRPRNTQFLANAGLVFQALGNWGKAAEIYQKLTEFTPLDDKAWYNFGLALQETGKIDQAEKAYRKATELEQTNSEYWKNLGLVLLKMQRSGDLEDALICFRKVTVLNKNDTEGFNNLSIVFGLLGDRDAALEAAQEAIKLDPHSWQPWLNLAQLYLRNDEVDEALAVYQKGIELAADKDKFNFTIGHTLNMLGKFDTATTFFKRAYEKTPWDLGILSQFINHQTFPTVDDPLLLKARTAVDEASDESSAVASLCFSLGKILDKFEQYESAFEYYHRGNRLRAKSLNFKPETHRKYIDSIIDRYNIHSIKSKRILGNPSEMPIYIVGMPRSGTTLTEQIIASHPLVAGGGERGFWSEVEKATDSNDTCEFNTIESIANACLEDLGKVKIQNKQPIRVTDKMPHNFLRVGMIHTTFPNARIIHVRRHPIDNCLSIFFQNFRDDHAYAFDLEHLSFYRREYERLMQHWRELMPSDRYFEFDYEDLVADQEGMSRKLLEFCGLEWDDACLNFHENKRAIKTASIWQVRQKIYSSSVERWRHYQPYISPLLSLLDSK